MNRCYLLDTSTCRALSYIDLQNLRIAGYPLCVSPYSFWEMICHLDECSFQRQKGQFQKFREITVLDDPRAEIERVILPRTDPISARLPDTTLISAALSALDFSDSISHFYRQTFVDDRGQVRKIENCCTLAREALKEEQKRYVRFVEKIKHVLKSEGFFKERRHQAVLSLIEGYVQALVRRGAIECHARAVLEDRAYLYFGYILHRSISLYENGAISTPANDYEDGRICLHLSLSRFSHFITDDQRTRKALDQTIELLGSVRKQRRETLLRVQNKNCLLIPPAGQEDVGRSGPGLHQ